MPTLAVVALVLVAGCPQGSSPGGGNGSGQYERLPPGVSESGVENVSRLVDGHNDSLSGTGYVSRLTYTTEVDRQGSGATYVARVAARGHPYLVRVENADGEWVYWGNRSVRLLRAPASDAGADRTHVYRYQAVGPPPGDPLFHGSQKRPAADVVRWSSVDLASKIEAGDWRPVPAEDLDRDDRVVLRATRLDESEYPDLNDTQRDRWYDGRLVLDREGRIRKLRITTTAPFAGKRVNATFEYELDVRPDLSVDRPDWVPDAYRRRTAVTIDVSVVDGEYLEVTNTGREPIPAGYAVTYVRPLTLQEPVEPGESVYLYPVRGEGIVLARSPPDDSAGLLEPPHRVSVTDGDGREVAVEVLTDDER